ncbi:uncharacterized protein LOC130678336 [Microplitis mediator]|uniref:uncharacterized protein LOC130678336 n=1 Tax=Microplitis mediator TaxID=375433 RepID=UPI0025520EF5|nr:uncharacterized protein LOC130678336 [Microplitis mediator]
MTKRALFIFAIVTIEIISIIIFIAFRTNSNAPLAPMKSVLIDREIREEHKEIAEKYHGNEETIFKTELGEKIEKVVPFGIALLSMSQLDNTKTQYLADVEDLIRRINTKLGGPVSNDHTIPWADDWYHCSVSLTRLLAMYDYIGKDKEIIDICHRRILEIIPKLNQSLGWVRTDHYVILLGIPRLLTLKKHRPDLYEVDIGTNEFIELQKQITLKPRTDNLVKNGTYQDYSCIHDKKVASFLAVTELGGFYLNAYHTLGYEENRSQFVRKLLDKILHPELDFIPYGLFSRYPKIVWDRELRNHWPNYIRNINYDVNIFPFIGLGVFKSARFVFSLRVQRTGIAAYESDKKNQQFALGWIQMRKLYLLRNDYSKYKDKDKIVMKWDKLKFQPGVISFGNASYDNFENFKNPNGTDGPFVRSSFCQEIESYIGHLKTRSDRKLLYWFYKYKFESFYGKNVVISEIGVCTDNGLVMRYEIDNNSGKELKLILNDEDINYETEKMYFEASPKDPGTGTSIPSGKRPVIVNWCQLFNENTEPKTVEWNDALNSMSFTFDREKYSIEQHGKYHIVKCNNEIILAGNSSSLRDSSITHYDTMSHKHILFERNPDTLMYKPHKN